MTKKKTEPSKVIVKLARKEQKQAFIKVLDEQGGHIQNAISVFGVSDPVYKEHREKDPDFAAAIVEVRRKHSKTKFKEASLYVSNELILEGLMAEWDKPEAERNIRKLDFLTKRAAELNGNLQTGKGDISITNDNRQVKVIQPKFVKADPSQFDVDLNELEEQMKAEEIKTNATNDYTELEQLRPPSNE